MSEETKTEESVNGEPKPKRMFLVRNITDKNHPVRTREQVINLPGSLQRCLVARDVLVSEDSIRTHEAAYARLVKGGMILILNRGSELVQLTEELQASPLPEGQVEAVPEFPLDSAARDENPQLVLPPEGENELPPTEFDPSVPESPAAAELDSLLAIPDAETKQEGGKKRKGNK